MASLGAGLIIDRMRRYDRAPSLFRQSMRKHVIAVCMLCVLAVGRIGIVEALNDVQLGIESIVGQGWRLKGIRVALGAGELGSSLREAVAPGLPVSVAIARAELASGIRVDEIRIDCPALRVHAAQIECSQANVAFSMPKLGRQRFVGKLFYDRGSGNVAANVRGAPASGARMHVKLSLSERRWSLQASLEQLRIEPLLALAAELQVDMPPVTATGRFSGTIAAAGAERLERLTLTATDAQLTAHNASGTLASDALSFSGRAEIVRAGESWEMDLALRSAHGQAYAQPLYMDFGRHALALRARGRVFGDRWIELRAFEIDHRDALHAEGSALVDLKDDRPLRNVRLTLHALQFPGAYATYLQPLLLATDFSSLRTSGRLEGQLEIQDGAPRALALRLEEIGLDGGSRKLLVRGLSGVIDWRDGGGEDEAAVLRAETGSSVLRWRGGRLLNLALGAGELQFATIGRHFRLTRATRIGLLDGALELASLRVRNIGLPSVAFMVDATLEPISVAEVCRAFGWPQFGGTLGGTISKLRLRDGVLTLGTVLQAQVFDGRVSIRDLRLEDPFGAWPRLYSNIALENLDLELVTRAFSFGRITGRLSGEIGDLRLFKWRPIAFDARFYTPENDRSRRRISQRAVQNIGSIGGSGAGVAQALSSGFLRFFDEFRYDRLGVSCRLENDVCHMDGIAPAPEGGYFLVRGSGVPRIDVIGNARRVDWPRLVRQLVAVTESERPVVR